MIKTGVTVALTAVIVHYTEQGREKCVQPDAGRRNEGCGDILFPGCNFKTKYLKKYTYSYILTFDLWLITSLVRGYAKDL